MLRLQRRPGGQIRLIFKHSIQNTILELDLVGDSHRERVINRLGGDLRNDLRNDDPEDPLNEATPDPIHQLFEATQEELVSVPATREQLSRLEIVQVRGTNMTEPPSCCPVCLDNFQEGATLVKMPCGHEFHSPCLFRWLGEHNTCPVCRYCLGSEESTEENARITVHLEGETIELHGLANSHSVGDLLNAIRSEAQRRNLVLSELRYSGLAENLNWTLSEAGFRHDTHLDLRPLVT